MDQSDAASRGCVTELRRINVLERSLWGIAFRATELKLVGLTRILGIFK
jgi:hypothetical protein